MCYCGKHEIWRSSSLASEQCLLIYVSAKDSSVQFCMSGDRSKQAMALRNRGPLPLGLCRWRKKVWTCKKANVQTLSRLWERPCGSGWTHQLGRQRLCRGRTQQAWHILGMLDLCASLDWPGLCSGHLPVIPSPLVGVPNGACSQTCNVGSTNEILLSLTSIAFTSWWSSPESCRSCPCSRSHSHCGVASRTRGGCGRCWWFVGPAPLTARSLSCAPGLLRGIPWLCVGKDSRGATQHLEEARECVAEDDAELPKLLF